MSFLRSLNSLRQMLQWRRAGGERQDVILWCFSWTTEGKKSPHELHSSLMLDDSIRSICGWMGINGGVSRGSWVAIGEIGVRLSAKGTSGGGPVRNKVLSSEISFISVSMLSSTMIFASFNAMLRMSCLIWCCFNALRRIRSLRSIFLRNR